MNDRERAEKFMRETQQEIDELKRQYEERSQAEMDRMRKQERLAEWGWIVGATETIDNLGKNVRRRR